ncbi:MAG: type III pantothenate kinase [Cyanobacteria bacterium J06638_7]
MKASEAAPRWLLIGNSRWHCARPEGTGLHCWSEASGRPGTIGSSQGPQLGLLLGWAAVGPLPEDAALDQGCRIGLSRVPLQRMPSWLGVDRALVGWQAWRRSGTAVLVADAGTALSLTLVDGEGRFRGGRIQAGLALQLQALASGTAQLPVVPAVTPELGLAPGASPSDPWPTVTAEAMALGVAEGLVAAVAEAWRQARSSEPGCRLWITGGDGARIAARLNCPYQPWLALEALAGLCPVSELRSGPDR